ncbi:MAG TPA: endonuclease/exonuclease/phosphatase family protein [Solirubrobacteraceae bacterium]|nr:endonuclease/exonuclease/phosphatase family protein [Solirubrobacteraceae bacterium]
MSHRKLGAALLAACALVPVAAPAAQAQSKQSKTSRDVTVMTRNLYLGADLIPLATQKDVPTFEAAAAQRFQTVQTNDFATRAKPLAAEIVKAKPDLIGLQEAATWRRSPDGVKDGTTTVASQTVYDSLQILTAELKKQGASYKVVAKRPWFDYEAPTSLGFDVRLTQYDAILARTGKGTTVKTGKTHTGGYTKTFDVPTQVGLARSPRGWVAVDAKVGGKAFRFVTTHLEAYSPEIADTQMQELLRKDLASKKRTSILVGDFNSDPKTTGTDDRGAERKPSAYATALDAGFFNPLKRRETCCFAEDLRSTSEKLDSWIDHIVVRPNARVIKSSIVGAASSERTGGLWPSDHAGIVATLRLGK